MTHRHPTTTVRLGSLEGARKLRLTRTVLRVEKGPDRGVQVAVEGGLVRAGKDLECHLVLTDPAVSRVHFTLEITEGKYLLKDLNSTNGTQVDGARVKEAWLVPGSRVRVGQTEMSFQNEEIQVPIPDSGVTEKHGLIGTSQAMRDLFSFLEIAAGSPMSLVVLGESGSGKEGIARALHQMSPRHEGAFVTFDCGNVEAALVGSALFGHASGAYTGAAGARKGAFLAADGGTLFLDEIGELPLELQSRLLRVLERREVQPLGSDAPVSVDVRVVCATHRDLEAMVTSGKFRQDLYYRLAGVVLEVPPLRDRAEDIALLARAFLAEVRPAMSLSVEAMARLEAHSWPGNVRELKNVIERSATFSKANVLGAAEILLQPLRPGGRSPAPPAEDAPAAATPALRPLDELEAQAIRKALQEAQGNKSQAARALGIARKTLREKMERFGILDPG